MGQSTNVCTLCALLFPERALSSRAAGTRSPHLTVISATGIASTESDFSGLNRLALAQLTAGFRRVDFMASFTLLRSGAWRVQVRRKGTYVAETFLRKTEAQDWAREAEIAIDRAFKPPRRGQPRPRRGKAFDAPIRRGARKNRCGPTLSSALEA